MKYYLVQFTFEKDLLQVVDSCYLEGCELYTFFPSGLKFRLDSDIDGDLLISPLKDTQEWIEQQNLSCDFITKSILSDLYQEDKGPVKLLPLDFPNKDSIWENEIILTQDYVSLAIFYNSVIV